jgi:hypothetical protein
MIRVLEIKENIYEFQVLFQVDDNTVTHNKIDMIFSFVSSPMATQR